MVQNKSHRQVHAAGSPEKSNISQNKVGCGVQGKVAVNYP
jgi:hypothetical protein